MLSICSALSSFAERIRWQMPRCTFARFCIALPRTLSVQDVKFSKIDSVVSSDRHGGLRGGCLVVSGQWRGLEHLMACGQLVCWRIWGRRWSLSESARKHAPLLSERGCRRRRIKCAGRVRVDDGRELRVGRTEGRGVDGVENGTVKERQACRKEVKNDQKIEK